jgi:hypothetical protein
MKKKFIFLFILIFLSLSFLTPNPVLSAGCNQACRNSGECSDPQCSDCRLVPGDRFQTCNAATQPPPDQPPSGNGANLKINFDALLGNIPRTIDGGVIDITNLTIEGIISALIPFIYVLAGLALLMMLIVGGFQLMMSAGDPKGVESGRNKVMYALIGFLIIFASFWLVQIAQVVFGLPKIF